MFAFSVAMFKPKCTHTLMHVHIQKKIIYTHVCVYIEQYVYTCMYIISTYTCYMYAYIYTNIYI